MDDIDYLRAGWRSLWDFIDLKGPPLKPVLALYREESRHYHGVSHIAACLRELRLYELAMGLPRQTMVELALYFHDAIYDPKASDNEARSAHLMMEMLQPILGQEKCEQVRRLIMATDHRAALDEKATADERLIRDIDLTILGTPWETFESYELAVRQEYAHVSDNAFRAGRSKVLRHFLEQPRLYATPHFYRQYEAAARVNLGRSLERWS